jgi:hypothetical protein
MSSLLKTMFGTRTIARGGATYLRMGTPNTTRLPLTLHSIACVALPAARFATAMRAAIAENVVDGFMTSFPPIAHAMRMAPLAALRRLRTQN